MPDQTNSLPAGQKSQRKPIRWVNIGIFFTTLGLVVFVVAFGYGYYQLSKINVALAQAASAAKKEATQASENVNALQQRLTDMQQEIKSVQEKVNEKPAVAANDSKTAELYSRLTALDKQIEQLPFLLKQQLAGQPADEMQAGNPESTESPDRWWRQDVEKMRTWLGKFVKVTYVGSANPVTMTPDSQALAYQYVHSQLEAAKWAVLHQNATIYHESLTQAAALINRYFVIDAAETRQVQSELQSLLSATLEKPNENQSIQSSVSATSVTPAAGTI